MKKWLILEPGPDGVPRESVVPARKAVLTKPTAWVCPRDTGANRRPPSGHSWNIKINKVGLDCHLNSNVSVCDISSGITLQFIIIKSVVEKRQISHAEEPQTIYVDGPCSRR